MSLLQVSNLTFCYEGSFDNIFENVSFSVDTDWKLGFIGRNGKGKTTFLNLLLGKYEYTGSITTDMVFDYFPYRIEKNEMDMTADELAEKWKPGVEGWRVVCELNSLGVDPEILYRPIKTLSFGERTKAMLAVLFSGENEFLLIDEPTNHLDKGGREIRVDLLSEGEKCTLAMIGDLARRLILANPAMENPLEGKGIVLIDEIELHMHPSWQRRILSILKEVFPNIQFIVTTHSPQVLGEADESFKIISLSLDMDENGVGTDQIERMDGFDSNMIAGVFIRHSRMLKNDEDHA